MKDWYRAASYKMRARAWAYSFRLLKWIAPRALFWIRAEDPDYLWWLVRHKRRFSTLPATENSPPRFSIVTPAFNTRNLWRDEAAFSVLAQTFSAWEWIVVDDGSTHEDSLLQWEALAKQESRIRWLRHPENLGIATATNRAVSEARGDWVVLLDHDDLLYPDTLAAFAEAIERRPDADIFYADEDRLSPRGLRYRSHFKPAFSPSLLEMCNYILHPLCIRRRLWESVKGMRSAFDGSQDYDLLLRCWDAGAQIVHVPGSYYTWREAETSMASGFAKPAVFDAGRRALGEHLERLGESYRRISDNPQTQLGDYRIEWHIPESAKVLLVADQAPNWRASWRMEFRHRSPRPWWAYVSLADDTSEQYDAIVVIPVGVVVERAAMVELIGWIRRESVGVVGAKLLDCRGRLVHAGVGLTDQYELSLDFYGEVQNYSGLACQTRDCFAVFGAVAIDWRLLTAIAQQPLVTNEQGALLTASLTARSHRQRVVYTPFAELIADRRALPVLPDPTTVRALCDHKINEVHFPAADHDNFNP